MADLDSFGLDLEAAIDEVVATLPPPRPPSSSAHEPGAGPERRRVGQVVPVEVGGR